MTNRLRSTGLAALSFTLSAGLLALALAPAMVVAATPGTDSEQFTVSGERLVSSRRVATADLDLADASDLKVLNARIRRAINDVCREPGNGRATLDSSRCDNEARRSADAQLAELRRLHTAFAEARAGRSRSDILVVAAR